VKPSTLVALAAATSSRRAIVFAKRLTDAAEFLLPDRNAPAALNTAGEAAMTRDFVGTQVIDGDPWFIEVRRPAPRLVLVGAVHIAEALAQLAVGTGFSVIVIDPRQMFRQAGRFSQTAIMTEWPDLALRKVGPDRETAVVALTHDPKLDDPALDATLGSDAFYIGALGSRKSHADRIKRLRQLGHSEAALQRIRGPVGLKIGAVSAAEIAVSIMAEIIAVRRKAVLAQRTEEIRLEAPAALPCSPSEPQMLHPL